MAIGSRKGGVASAKKGIETTDGCEERERKGKSLERRKGGDEDGGGHGQRGSRARDCGTSVTKASGDTEDQRHSAVRNSRPFANVDELRVSQDTAPHEDVYTTRKHVRKKGCA